MAYAGEWERGYDAVLGLQSPNDTALSHEPLLNPSKWIQGKSDWQPLTASSEATLNHKELFSKVFILK